MQWRHPARPMAELAQLALASQSDLETVTSFPGAYIGSSTETICTEHASTMLSANLVTWIDTSSGRRAMLTNVRPQPPRSSWREQEIDHAIGSELAPAF